MDQLSSKIGRLAHALWLCAPVLVFCAGALWATPAWPKDHPVHETAEFIGTALLMLCITGTIWCSLYLHVGVDRELVTWGPYSICRNPSSTFLMLGFAGMGAQFGSFTAMVLSGVAAWLLLHLLSIENDKRLRARYGDRFVRYAMQVPRFFPRPALWRNGPSRSIGQFRLNIFHANSCLLLFSIPVAELLEHTNIAALAPVLFRIL